MPQWQHMADSSLMTRCCQSAPCSLRRRRRSGKVHARDRHDNVSAVLATEKQSLADLRLAWMLPLAVWLARMVTDLRGQAWELLKDCNLKSWYKPQVYNYKPNRTVLDIQRRSIH